MKSIYKLLSLPFQLTNMLINYFYEKGIKESIKVDIPVVSIGNISFGGEGKTPVVITLGKFLLSKGIKPAILLRGYKGKKEREGAVISDGKIILKDWEEGGDEALLISENVPGALVMVGKNRIKSAIRALKMGTNLILLDDGFQHRKIHRDLDVVILSDRPTLYREFFSSISRADAILINSNFENEKLLSKIRKISVNLPVFRFTIKNSGFIDKSGNLIDIKDRNIIAFCGIANPARFNETLERAFIKPKKTFYYPDHHKFSLKDSAKIEKEAEKIGADLAVTTEKDFIRLRDLNFSIPVVYLKIEAHFENDFYEFFVEKIGI